MGETLMSLLLVKNVSLSGKRPEKNNDRQDART